MIGPRIGPSAGSLIAAADAEIAAAKIIGSIVWWTYGLAASLGIFLLIIAAIQKTISRILARGTNVGAEDISYTGEEGVPKEDRAAARPLKA